MTHISSPIDQTVVPAQHGHTHRMLGVLASLAGGSIINVSIVLVFAFSLSVFMMIAAVLALPLFVYAYVTCGTEGDE